VKVRSRSCWWLTLFCVLFAYCGGGAWAAEPPVRVLVSFSILEDIVHEIGGADVTVTSLIGPDSDAHVFEPSPDQLRVLAQAQLFVVNGLGLEGWETRLVQSAQYGGPVVVASHGISPIETASSGAPAPDPHAWQDVKNAEIYAANIAQALEDADPERADDYRPGARPLPGGAEGARPRDTR
jgi:zinc/manganese transport system substrate-binding protein